MMERSIKDKWKLLIPLLIVVITLPAANFLNMFMPYSEKLWRGNDLDYFSLFWISVSIIQFLGLVFCLASIKFNHFPLSDFGYHLGKQKTIYFLLVLILIAGIGFFVLEKLIILGIEQQCFVAPKPLMRVAYLISLVNAGVTEEFIFRGFCYEYMKKLKMSKFLAVLLSCLSFTLIHGINVINAFHIYFIFGLIMSLIYIWRKNILIPIFIHIAYNIFTVFYCFI